jgi:hypothetical protein
MSGKLTNSPSGLFADAAENNLILGHATCLELRVGHPETDVSGGLKLPRFHAAKKEFAVAALNGILADVRPAR